jgi:hypothetical protein
MYIGYAPARGASSPIRINTVIDKSKLIGSGGVRLTKSLFVEYEGINEGVQAKPSYTLSRVDKDGYPSLYRLYMESGDVTEAKFVELYMYDLRHWEVLCATKFFGSEVDFWRKDLKLKKLGEAVARLEVDAASKASKTATSSAKYLIDKIYKVKAKPAGRPTSASKMGEPSVSREIEADVIRVFKGFTG